MWLDSSNIRVLMQEHDKFGPRFVTYTKRVFQRVRDHKWIEIVNNNSFANDYDMIMKINIYERSTVVSYCNRTLRDERHGFSHDDIFSLQIHLQHCARPVILLMSLIDKLGNRDKPNRLVETVPVGISNKQSKYASQKGEK